MIKDALRRDVAVEFLIQSDLPLPQVVTRVGFSEASTFYGAFKGWMGWLLGRIARRITKRLRMKRWLDLRAFLCGGGAHAAIERPQYTGIRPEGGLLQTCVFFWRCSGRVVTISNPMQSQFKV